VTGTVVVVDTRFVEVSSALVWPAALVVVVVSSPAGVPVPAELVVPVASAPPAVVVVPSAPVWPAVPSPVAPVEVFVLVVEVVAEVAAQPASEAASATAARKRKALLISRTPFGTENDRFIDSPFS